MPIERKLLTVLEMPDDDLIRWREDVRKILSEHHDDELAALYQASGQEIVVRAEEAWSAARSCGTEPGAPR
jgi:hypothetical protein